MKRDDLLANLALFGLCSSFVLPIIPFIGFSLYLTTFISLILLFSLIFYKVRIDFFSFLIFLLCFFSGALFPGVDFYLLCLSLVVFPILLFNIILNIILIPKFGIVGASISATAAYILNFILRVFIYSKFTKINYLSLILIPKDEFIYVLKKIKFGLLK